MNSEKDQGKVLIVEDYFINMDLTKEMLEMLNCISDTAEDGNEAIEQYNSNSYDLILMDIQMPNKDGIEAAKEIRQIESTQNKQYTPIVAVTANVMEEDRVKCLNAGMDDFITKPLKLSELKKVVQKYVNKGSAS